MADTQTTRLSRKWIRKICIFLIGLPLLGAFFVWDGFFQYPKRGRLDAAFRLHQYFETRPLSPKVEDVDAVRRELEEKREQGAGALKAEEAALLEFLLALERLWQPGIETLKLPITTPSGEPRYWDIARGEAFTVDADGNRSYELQSTTRADLTKHWAAASKPKPLSNLDIPSQWVVSVILYGLWIWPIVLVVKAARTKYRWQPDEQRLTLPDGSSFVPDDISEFDKTRWHKYYLTVHLNDGRALTFDLLRFDPLESWLEQMEKARFPETAEEEETPEPEDAADAAPDETESASADGSAEGETDNPDRSPQG